MIVKLTNRIDPVMEIILRYRRESAEAHALGIAHVHKLALRMRAIAFVLFVLLGAIWLLAQQ